jgi:excisionase family DNA binding protein
MVIIQLDSEQLNSVIQNAIRKVLSEIPKPNQPKNDRIFIIKEAAEFINKSVPTLYALVSRGEIKHSKKGKRLYFFEEDLISYIKEGRRKTQTELAADAKTYIAHKSKKRG